MRYFEPLLIEPAANAAVEWWGSQLERTPKFDNGDKSRTGGMAMVLSMMVHQQLPEVGEKQIAEFKDALKYVLLGDMQITGCMQSTVSVDYGPDWFLRAAAQAADIPDGDHRFPWKTTMWINPGLVTVSCGYAAPAEHIYMDWMGAELLLKRAQDAIDYYSKKEPSEYYTAEEIEKSRKRAISEHYLWAEQYAHMVRGPEPEQTVVIGYC
ncbi:MAG: hypothetical protein ACYTFI_00905 [Planctomycetota bacterium]